jgi:hypothetical protein
MKRPIDRLAQLLANPVTTEVPKGWKTIGQMAAEARVSRPTIGVLVREAVAAGQMEKRIFKIQTNSIPRPIAHYHPKK